MNYFVFFFTTKQTFPAASVLDVHPLGSGIVVLAKKLRRLTKSL